MNLIDAACVTLGLIVVAPLAVLTAPITLPIYAVVALTRRRRFWKLRTGDVFGSFKEHAPIFVVIRPPSCKDVIIFLEVWHPHLNTLFVFRDAQRAYQLFETPPFATMTLQHHDVVDLVLNTDINGGTCVEGLLEPHQRPRDWKVYAIFLLTRPVRVIQRAWRAHMRRRRAAVEVISRTVLEFLYRPGGAMYRRGEKRWHEKSIVAFLGKTEKDSHVVHKPYLHQV